jgi:hypothetical protein
MFKNSWLSFFKFNKFEFGEQKVTQFVVFECKYLFSIIIFYFHKSSGYQDRFHTHAFNALSIKLFGNYTEQILLDETSGSFSLKRRNSILQFFPRDSYHKLGLSNGCSTILISGPWKKSWKEKVDGDEIVTYSWNRKHGT